MLWMVYTEIFLENICVTRINDTMRHAALFRHFIIEKVVENIRFLQNICTATTYRYYTCLSSQSLSEKLRQIQTYPTT